MKTIKFIFLILSTLSFQMCDNNSFPHNMEIADTLVYNNPDSAIILLQQVQDSITTKSQATQIYYQLLTLKAKDKAYISHTSDSSILQILHYYIRQKDKKHLTEAYYYAGRVYRDLGDSPQALDYFQKAIESSKKNKDYRLTSKINTQMGILFLYQDIYDEAMKHFREAYKYNISIHDAKSAIFNLRDIGDAFMAYNNADSALYYHHKAYENATSLKNQWLCEVIEGRLADIYLQLHKYELAKTMLQRSLRTRKTGYKTAAYSIYADLYYQTGHLDSAIYYYKKLSACDRVYAKQEAHLGLAKIAYKQADCENALKHIQEYTLWTDSIRRTTNQEAIQKIQSLYNYQVREKENNQLKNQNTQQTTWIITILLILSLLIIIFLIYFQRSHHNRNQLQNSLRELKRLEKEEHQKSIRFIEENKRKMEILETSLQKSNETNKTIQKLLQAQKEQIICLNSKIEADLQEHEFAVAAFKQSSIYAKFHNASNLKDLKDEDWLQLQQAINTTYSNFTYQLYSLYPISNIELRICLLIKADISISSIALLLGRSKSTITSARKKLYEKVYGQKGSPEMWDNLISSL